ncbi:Uncharacterized protein CLAVI_000848 [Candidatus Clavichlamydia salmonicola]|nr:Uncharacterized protein [Candidatus Clavichlamydia salmonicola]
MLFAGQDDLLVEIAARSFALRLVFGSNSDNCPLKDKMHPDIHEYRPEGKTGLHLLETLKSVKDDIWLKSATTQHKIFIIYRADQMLPSGANAMLKMFEEPSEGTVILLTTSNINRMLPTIVSRSRVFHFSLNEQRAFSPREQALIDILQERPFSYSKIKNFSIAFETHKKNKEKELKKKFCEKNDINEYSAKELSGILAIWSKDEVEKLLNVIFLWYRDLFLQSIHIKEEYGTFKNFNIPHNLIKVLSLKKIELLLEDALIFLERSGKLSACLEWFFCKIEQLESYTSTTFL